MGERLARAGARSRQPEACVNMRTAEIVALVYFAYLAAVSIVRGTARARLVCIGALASVAVLDVAWARTAAGGWMSLVREAWPLGLLFAGYRAAGAFDDPPDVALERWLMRVDRRVGAWWASATAARLAGPRGARYATVLLEGAYLGVYVVIPLGAMTVALAGPAAAVDQFWTVVLASGFVCYGALPWIATRPPRCLDTSVQPYAASGVRRVNLAILECGSVGANTLPSGHAATAVATAMAVAPYAPFAGAALAVAALLIAIATVVGRYHYTVDTALGVIVGLVVPLVVRAL